MATAQRVEAGLGMMYTKGSAAIAEWSSGTTSEIAF